MLKSLFVSFAAMPLPPLNVTVSQVTSSNASVVWVPGFDGRAPLHSCTLQVRVVPLTALVVPSNGNSMLWVFYMKSETHQSHLPEEFTEHRVVQKWG